MYPSRASQYRQRRTSRSVQRSSTRIRSFLILLSFVVVLIGGIGYGAVLLWNHFTDQSAQTEQIQWQWTLHVIKGSVEIEQNGTKNMIGEGTSTLTTPLNLRVQDQSRIEMTQTAATVIRAEQNTQLKLPSASHITAETGTLWIRTLNDTPIEADFPYTKAFISGAAHFELTASGITTQNFENETKLSVYKDAETQGKSLEHIILVKNYQNTLAYTDIPLYEGEKKSLESVKIKTINPAWQTWNIAEDTHWLENTSQSLSAQLDEKLTQNFLLRFLDFIRGDGTKDRLRTALRALETHKTGLPTPEELGRWEDPALTNSSSEITEPLTGSTINITETQTGTTTTWHVIPKTEPTTQPTGSGTVSYVYVLKKGESVSAVAIRYGYDWKTWVQFLGITAPEKLEPGTPLDLPADFVTILQKKDPSVLVKK